MPKYYSAQEKIYHQLLLLESDDEFAKDVSAIRKKVKKFGVKTELSNDGEEIDIDYFFTPEFDKDIYRLRREYNLSGLYDMPLRLYFQFNRVPDIYKIKLPSHLMPDLIPRHEILDVFSETIGEEETVLAKLYPNENWEDEEHVMVELFPETTLKDFVKNWKKISEKRDELYGIISKGIRRTVKSENLKRDLKILILKKQGKKCVDISKITGVSYQDVSKIIKRLKERAKKNIPHKET